MSERVDAPSGDTPSAEDGDVVPVVLSPLLPPRLRRGRDFLRC
ncbi:hypothetical protein [Agromyces marinus]|nr:hypothetical protein [Agromyces marinus]